MICAPCAKAADEESAYQQTTGVPSGLRDTHRRCTGGCTCQHKPITPKERQP